MGLTQVGTWSGCGPPLSVLRLHEPQLVAGSLLPERFTEVKLARERSKWSELSPNLRVPASGSAK